MQAVVMTHRKNGHVVPSPSTALGILSDATTATNPITQKEDLPDIYGQHCDLLTLGNLYVKSPSTSREKDAIRDNLSRCLVVPRRSLLPSGAGSVYLQFGYFSTGIIIFDGRVA